MSGHMSEPIAMLLHCPQCTARHVDAGEFATKPHHTHACQSCGMTWRPALGPTVGVLFLPGFKDAEPLAEINRGYEADWSESQPSGPHKPVLLPIDAWVRHALWLAGSHIIDKVIARAEHDAGPLSQFIGPLDASYSAAEELRHVTRQALKARDEAICEAAELRAKLAINVRVDPHARLTALVERMEAAYLDVSPEHGDTQRIARLMVRDLREITDDLIHGRRTTREATDALRHFIKAYGR